MAVFNAWAGKTTGRRRYRQGWFGRIILQVECERIMMVGTWPTRVEGKIWRDAKASDVGLPTVCVSTPTFLSIAHDSGVVEHFCEKEKQ